MTTDQKNIKELAEDAMQIFNGHDWYWMMADCDCTKAARRAESNMRLFVKTIAGLTEDLREAFRNLWIATYEYHNCFRPMWTAPDVHDRETAMQAAEAAVKFLLSETATAA